MDGKGGRVGEQGKMGSSKSEVWSLVSDER